MDNLSPDTPPAERRIDITVKLKDGKDARFVESSGPDRSKALITVGKPFVQEIDGVRVHCAQFGQSGKSFLRYVNMSGPMNTVWLERIHD